jgi:hypothetical protein
MDPHRRLLSLLLAGAISNAEYRLLVSDLNRREQMSANQ